MGYRLVLFLSGRIDGGSIQLWRQAPESLLTRRSRLVAAQLTLGAGLYECAIINDETGRVITWIIPHSAEATRKRLDEYLLSIADLEARRRNHPGRRLPEGELSNLLTRLWIELAIRELLNLF